MPDRAARASPAGVLITRPADAAADTARRLVARGWRPVFAPVVAIERVVVDLPPPGALQAVLVTSASGVRMLPAAYFEVPLLAVGDATACRARAAGFMSTRSAAGDAAALAALVARTCSPSRGPLLHACGRAAPDLLGATLASSGFEVLRREVYAARPMVRLSQAVRKELAGNRVAAALFFSPATARTFVALLGHDIPPDAVADVTAIAISDAAAAALAPLPWRHIRVASRPNQDELLAHLP